MESATARATSKRARQKDLALVSVSDFDEVFHAQAPQRIRLIREGVRARDVKDLQERLGMPQSVFLDSLRLSTATLNRKASKQENLSPEDSERVLGVSKLIGQVSEMVRRSGNPDGFDAARWLAGWLQQPVPALAGARPLDFLDTLEGQGMVSDILARMQSGAYS
ncbi:type II RES/Xre toxin-antitoxin system antitoxin [Rhizobium sp.]